MAPINVFISHCEEDTAQACALIRAVGEVGGRCFSYVFNPAFPGTDWGQWLASAIQHAHIIALLWSEDAAQSEWIDREIAQALASGKPVIPVLLEDIACPRRLPRTQAILAYKDPAGWVMQFRSMVRPVAASPLQGFARPQTGPSAWKKAAGLGLLGLLGAALLSGEDETPKGRGSTGKSRRR
jgi:hypothetical protein